MKLQNHLHNATHSKNMYTPHLSEKRLSIQSQRDNRSFDTRAIQMLVNNKESVLEAYTNTADPSAKLVINRQQTNQMMRTATTKSKSNMDTSNFGHNRDPNPQAGVRVFPERRNLKEKSTYSANESNSYQFHPRFQEEASSNYDMYLRKFN